MVDYIYRFAYVKPALHPWNVLLDLVCQYLINDFPINVRHGYWPAVFFFSCVSARFWYQDDVGLMERVREDSLFFDCLE